MIWVEVLSHHRDVLSRHRVERDSATIGRGYGCDVVLDDPHVAAAHLRVSRDAQGQFAVEDLGTLNGLYVGRERMPTPKAVLEPDQPIRIGGTWLRLRSADHPVATERPPAPSSGGWVLPATLVAGALGLALLETWLSNSGEPKLSEYLAPPTLALLLGAAWAGAWAIASRVFSHRARYPRHLETAFGGLLAFAIVNRVLSLLAYAVSAPALSAHGYLPLWLILAVVCLLHLLAINPRHRAWKAGLVAVATLAGIGFSLLLRQEQRETFGPSVVLGELYPPSLRLVPAIEPDRFFASSLALKDDLDRARVEAVHEGDSDRYNARYSSATWRQEKARAMPAR